MQAVVIAIAHIAERYAIQCEPHLILAETTHAEAGRPFIGAKRISRFKTDARQFIQRFQRAGARSDFNQVITGDVLNLTGITLTKHNNSSNIIVCLLCSGIQCKNLYQ